MNGSTLQKPMCMYSTAPRKAPATKPAMMLQLLNTACQLSRLQALIQHLARSFASEPWAGVAELVRPL